MEVPVNHRYHKSKRGSRKENLLAVFLAAFLSFIVYHGAAQYGMLSADITGGPQPEFNDVSDIVVVQEGAGKLALKSGKIFEDLVSISILLLFDEQTVRISEDDLRSSFGISYAPAGAGKVMIILENAQGKTIDRKENLLTITLAGNQQDIVIGDVVASFVDTSSEGLSVQLPR